MTPHPLRSGYAERSGFKTGHYTWQGVSENNPAARLITVQPKQGETLVDTPWQVGIMQISVTCRCLAASAARLGCRGLYDRELAVDKLLRRL